MISIDSEMISKNMCAESECGMVRYNHDYTCCEYVSMPKNPQSMMLHTCLSWFFFCITTDNKKQYRKIIQAEGIDKCILFLWWNKIRSSLLLVESWWWVNLLIIHAFSSGMERFILFYFAHVCLFMNHAAPDLHICHAFLLEWGGAFWWRSTKQHLLSLLESWGDLTDAADIPVESGMPIVSVILMQATNSARTQACKPSSAVLHGDPGFLVSVLQKCLAKELSRVV